MLNRADPYEMPQTLRGYLDIMTRKIYLTLVILSFTSITCNFSDEEMIYDYALLDINPHSDTYGINIGPNYFVNQVTVHYFGHQG